MYHLASHSVLFHLFDFNEEGKLTLRELEFLIDCSMLSIFKIYDVRADLDRDNIASFIYNSFSEDTEITCKRLLTWCSKSSELQEFFKILKKELPKPISSIRNPFLKREPQPLVGEAKFQKQTTIEILEEKIKKKKKEKASCRTFLDSSNGARRSSDNREVPLSKTRLDTEFLEAPELQHIESALDHAAAGQTELGVRDQLRSGDEEFLLPQRVAEDIHPQQVEERHQREVVVHLRQDRCHLVRETQRAATLHRAQEPDLQSGGIFRSIDCVR